MLPPPTSEDLAIIFGFAEGKSPYVPKPRLLKDETERMDCIANCIAYYKEIGRGNEREITYAKFCARYLPAVMDRFLDAPILGLSGPFQPELYELVNTSLFIMLVTYHIPYFTKYIRSQKPVAARGKVFTQVLAERIARFGAFMDLRKELNPPDVEDEIEVFTDLLVEALVLFSIFVKFFAKYQEPIKTETRNDLSRYLIKWRQRGWDTSLQRESNRVFADLQGMSKELADYVEAGRKQLKARDKCAYPGCEIRDNLRACVKCSIVAYCSTAHQKAHWDAKDPDIPAHKPTCFETEY
ncbi:hypothetical protein BDN72DRAFT_331808 [Pluteus cervinus]|uniref:Uncharacterized protein n=1 Tax=Pluteus cervinus TaxID=181527 RepID=A0ACD3ACE1_9AGAR|nr:hypothetical protein BDN72DRAFT_331808 [Pluteus cervinus]